MKIIFWICIVCDIIIFFCFASALLNTISSGVIASKSKSEITQYILLFGGVTSLAIAAGILYYNQWYKTAALLSSIPLACLLTVLFIPIIAMLSGARMN